MQGNQINFEFPLKKKKKHYNGLVGRTVKGQEESLSPVSIRRWQRDFYSSAACEIADCIDLLCTVMG